MFSSRVLDMNRSQRKGLVLAVAAVLVTTLLHWSGKASGETVIYKSTDAEGKVTYGDSPPDDAVAVEEIRLPAPHPVGARELRERKERIESLVATADRLRSDRMQRESQRIAEVAPGPPPAPQPEFYPQYRASHGPWFVPSPFGAYPWRHFDLRRRPDDHWHGPNHGPRQHGQNPDFRHRSSVLRNPAGR